MKKLIIMSISLLGFSSPDIAGEIKKEKNTCVSKVINTKAAFDNIIINGNMDVVLIENDFAQVEIQGDKKRVAAIKHCVKNGTLYLKGEYSEEKESPVVYISVNGIKSIEIYGKSNVISKGSLNSSKLRVFITDGVKFNIRNYGNIFLEADADIILQYEMWIKEQNRTFSINPSSKDLREADAHIDAQFKKSIDSSYAML